MRSLGIALLIFAAAVTSLLAADKRDPLIGTWTGKSTCTAVRPACQDEQALYRIRATDGDETVVRMLMSKVVDGDEIVMGELPFTVDYERQSLSADNSQDDVHALWTFTWSGSDMIGTLTLLPKRDVIRNVVLTKRTE